MHWHVDIENQERRVAPGPVGDCCEQFATWKEFREADR